MVLELVARHGQFIWSVSCPSHQRTNGPYQVTEIPSRQPATILVVDDNDIVLKMVVTLLRSVPFRVIDAWNGEQALKVASDYKGRIDLLLSDIEMPGMTGPDLGAQLKGARPEIRVMFMSGFSDGNLLVLNYGWAFIPKPFVSTKLVEMIDSVLHSPDRSQGSYEFDQRKES